MTVFCLFDCFNSEDDYHLVGDYQLVGVVDSKGVAIAFVGQQFNEPNTKRTRYFEEIEVTEQYQRDFTRFPLSGVDANLYKTM
jgi:hypothetical protein